MRVFCPGCERPDLADCRPDCDEGMAGIDTGGWIVRTERPFGGGINPWVAITTSPKAKATGATEYGAVESLMNALEAEAAV